MCSDATTGDDSGFFDDQSTVLIGASSSTGVDLRPFRGFISGRPKLTLVYSHYLFSVKLRVAVHECSLQSRHLCMNSLSRYFVVRTGF